MDKIKYVNHLGKEISLWGADENSKIIVSSYRAARAYRYSYENGSLDIDSKEWVSLIVCARDKINELIETMEADNISKKTGRFYINEWYIRCNFLGISEVLFENEKFVKFSAIFAAPENIWSKESKTVLSPQIQGSGIGLNYPHTFPHTYGGTASSVKELENTSALPADFKLSTQGTGAGFAMSIGNLNYTLSIAIAKDEALFLNTEEKTVYKSTRLGQVDLFPASSDTDYIFSQIPPGKHTVVWRTKSDLNFTIIEHRRTPPWI